MSYDGLGPLHCPMSCCGGGGPFDFYGRCSAHTNYPTSDPTGVLDMLYLTDSVREVGVGSPYTSVDEGWFADYDDDPIPHAAEHKGILTYTIAPWAASGEYCWVFRTGNRFHPDCDMGAEKFNTTTLSNWSEGIDAEILSGDEEDVFISTATDHSGTHTEIDGETNLTDDSQSWTADELIGQTLNNTTTGSSGAITDNTSDTVIASMSGGSPDDLWDNEDEYTIDEATENAYIEESFSGLTDDVWYRFLLVAQSRECTKIRVTITGMAASPTGYTIDLANHTGGDYITQVDEDVYEHCKRIYKSTTGGTVTIQIRMVSGTSTTEYDGSSGDGVIIEWVSLREEGDAGLVDFALCNVVSGELVDHYLPDTTDDSDLSYTFPKTALESVPAGTTESQTTYPDASGLNLQEIATQLSGTEPMRGYGPSGSEFDGVGDDIDMTLNVANGGDEAWWISDDTAAVAVFGITGIDVVLKMHDGDFTTLIGGPADLEIIEEPPSDEGDFVEIGVSERVTYYDPDTGTYEYVTYYYESADSHDAAPDVPRVVAMPQHSYPKVFGYLPPKSPKWDAEGLDPRTASDLTYEQSWTVYKVVSMTNTVRVLFDDITERSFSYKRTRPNPVYNSTGDDWYPASQMGSSSETVISMGEDCNTLWSKSHTTSRVVIFAVNGSIDGDDGKLGIGAYMFSGADTVNIECNLIWGDADGEGNAKAIIVWRVDDVTITDPHDGDGYISPWDNEDDADEKPVEHLENYSYGVVVTGEVSESATSYAEAKAAYQGLCCTGTDRFVYFEKLDDNGWKMHVTGADPWSLETDVPVTGTHTAVASDEHVLTDSTKSWEVDEWVGIRIYNITGSRSGIITENTSNTITTTSSLWWDQDEEYRIGTDIPDESPDCIAASERHFYVTGFWLHDNRMANGYSLDWCFGHKEDDPAWPIREIVTGDYDDDQSSLAGSYLASPSTGATQHDCVKNSSALSLVPEQDRYENREYP